MRNPLRDVSVSKKLWAISGLSLALLILLAALGVASLISSNRQSQMLYQTRVLAYQKLLGVQAILASVHADTYKLISWSTAKYDTSKLEAAAEDQKQRLKKAQEQFQAMVDSRSQGKAFDTRGVPDLMAKYTKTHSDVADFVTTDPALATLTMATCDEAFQGLGTALQALAAEEEAAMNAGLADLSARSRRTLVWQILFAAGLGSAMIGLSSLIGRGISKPLVAAADILEAVRRDRDFTLRITSADTRDEIGTICRTFNELNGSFQGFFSSLGGSASQIASGAAELSASAEEMDTASQHISHGSDEILQISHHIRESTTQLSESILQIADMARVSQQRTGQAVEAVRKGQEAGQNTSQAMEDIRAASGQMEGAVRLIQDIARQTNLLSLNAAIEAAKAGQLGKGFAVVADEIRKLAERSAAATKEINELIRGSHESVTRGTETVATSVASLEEIQTLIHEVAHFAQTIGEAARKESELSQSVAVEIERSNANISQNVSATHELSASTHEIKKTAEDLARIADALRHEVAAVKV